MTTEIKTPTIDDFKTWVACLNLKIAAVQAELEYAYATSFCSDCPNSVDDDHPRYGAECCRETGEFDEQFEPERQELHDLEAARIALLALIPDGE